MLFQAGRQLGAFGIGNRDEIFDTDRVHHLAAKALGNQASTDAFARRIDSCGGTGWATTDDQHVVRRLLAQLGGLAFGGTGIQFADDLRQRHAPLAEWLTIEVNIRHRHDLPRGDLILEQGTIDHGVGDVRIKRGHQIQCLDDIRAVLAGERNIGLEVELTFQIPDLFQQRWIGLGRVPTALQQSQNQRGELVPHRDAGKMHAWRLTGRADAQSRLADRVAADQGNLVRHAGNLFGQRQQLGRLRRVITGHADLNRLLDVLEVTIQLLFELYV